MRRSVSFLSEERKEKSEELRYAACGGMIPICAAQRHTTTLRSSLFTFLFYLMPNSLFPFSMVSRAISSVVMPLIWASFSAM